MKNLVKAPRKYHSFYATTPQDIIWQILDPTLIIFSNFYGLTIWQILYKVI